MKKVLLNMSILITLLFSLSTLIFAAENSIVPHPVQYSITTYDKKAKNCSAIFTDLENNKAIIGNCENCVCMGELANLDYKQGDIISANICIHDNAFCREDRFKIEGSLTEINIDFHPCIPKYEIYLSIIPYTKDNKLSNSKDLLYLKEDDILILDGMDIIKRNDCDFEGWQSYFKIIKPNGEKNNPFGIRSIDIPKLNQGDIYKIKFQNLFIEESSDYRSQRSNYSTYINNIFKGDLVRRGTQNLFYVGTYSISSWLGRENTQYFEEEKYMLDLKFLDNNIAIEPEFKVTNKAEHIMIGIANKSLFWSIGTFIISIIAIFITSFLAIKSINNSVKLFNIELKNKKEYDEKVQKDLLRSVRTQLRCIERDIGGHQKELNKTPPIIPSYDITHVDANYYITNIRSEIKGHETEILKETIILLSNKIKNINRLLHLAQEFDSSNIDDTTLNPHVNELKSKKYKYHKHLMIFVEDIGKDIKQILYSKLIK